MHVSTLTLGDGFSSTAIGPLEIFRNAGVVWNMLLGEQIRTAFDVTTVSHEGKRVRFAESHCRLMAVSGVNPDLSHDENGRIAK